MKKLIKKLNRTVVFILKTILFLSLFMIFYLLFSIPNWQLLNLSRTAAVTTLTFCVVGLGMLAAYGTYDIGKRKSKPIICSLALATFITDLVTYIQLSIMNTNKDNNPTFKLENIGLFILAFVLQTIVICIMTYLGNYIYFRMNRPEKSCIITSSQRSLNQYFYGVDKYKLQYKPKYIVDYRDPKVYKYIADSDTVFLFDVPVEMRTHLVEYCYRLMKNIYFNPEISDIVEINSKHIILDDVSLICSQVKE